MRILTANRNEAINIRAIATHSKKKKAGRRYNNWPNQSFSRAIMNPFSFPSIAYQITSCPFEGIPLIRRPEPTNKKTAWILEGRPPRGLFASSGRKGIPPRPCRRTARPIPAARQTPPAGSSAGRHRVVGNQRFLLSVALRRKHRRQHAEPVDLRLPHRHRFPCRPYGTNGMTQNIFNRISFRFEWISHFSPFISCRSKDCFPNPTHHD